MTILIDLLRRYLAPKYIKYLQVFYYKFKNELIYLETHITNHCNLNCRSCRHFSPISNESFRDLDSFIRDMKRMRELFSNIRIIRLMGGEPLLHPCVTDFLTTTREAFPKAEIHLVTNGILLAKMNEQFWTSCASSKIILDVTRYPIHIDLVKIRELSNTYGVMLSESPLATKFHHYHMNRKGDSNAKETFNACRRESYCPFLDSDRGRLHICAISASAGIYSDYFKDNQLITSDSDSISIHGDTTSKDIFRFLSSSIPFCRYCTTKKTLFDWTRSSLVKEEWFD